MSRTYIHTEKGKFNNGIDDDNVSISLRKHWCRSNYDLGWQKFKKLRKICKQSDKDIKQQLNK